MIEQLLSAYPIISDQVDKRELRVILQELDKVLDRNVTGDVVEFGCYEGTTSVFIQRLLTGRKSGKEFHVYDSFEGLPEKSAEDQSPVGIGFKGGELRASKQALIKNFRRTGLDLPVIHRGWFNEIVDAQVPAEVAFAFLDGDFYESIRDSLLLIENKLSPGAMVVVDDYQSEALPGAAKAVNEWLKTRQHKLRIEASLAIIKL